LPSTETPEPGITVLGKGPIHEAYARPASLPYQPPPIVDKKPPEPIPEEPAAQKPEGQDVLWVPGYWSWDSDGKDWIWVSGFWRNPPPNRKWVPGHWSNTEQGWQWAPGFWANADYPDINYLNPPPASLELGPSRPRPDEDSAYVPGLWVPRQEGYLWRPGYWMDCRPGWIWNNSQFAWSPSGTIYVDGYWDYPFENRGCLFAPVSFNRPLWTNPSWRYRPNWVVGCNSLYSSLFINPSWGCYCFGNYFSPSYLQAGFQPWCTFGGRCWDPLFGYARWSNRGNPNWSANLKSQFLAVRNGEIAPPPATINSKTLSVQQITQGIKAPAAGKPLVTPLGQVNLTGPKMASLSAAQLALQKGVIQQTRDLSAQRAKVESTGSTLANTGATRSTSLKLPWAQSSVSPAKAASDASANFQPGVHVLRSGTGNANNLPQAVYGAREMPRITSGSSLPQIINSAPKTFTPSNAAPVIRAAPSNSLSTPPPRPSAPAPRPPPQHYNSPHLNYAPPASGGRTYSMSKSTFSGGGRSHYSGGGSSFKSGSMSVGHSGGGGHHK
jgi:hypothetical protein